MAVDDNEGDLPIHYAARFNNGDACEYLIKVHVFVFVVFVFFSRCFVVVVCFFCFFLGGIE